MVGDVYLRFNDTGWPSSDYFIKIFLHGSDIRIKDLGNGWKQCSASFTTHSTTTKITEVRFDADAAGVNVFIANVQLEQKSYATSYTDGTRGNETLSVPADGIISREQGTVEMVIQTLMPQTAMTAQRRFFWSWGTDGTNAGLDCVQGNGKFYFRNYYTPGSAQQAMYTIPANFENAPHYLAFTWSASKGTMKLYLDGIAVATATYGIQDNLVQPKIGIGCLNGSGFPVSSIISDFRISAIDRTDAEITVINNSGNFLPLPIDGMTTMKLEVENGIANPIIPFRMYADGTLQVTELVEQVNL
jgi:hypothetical protein